MDDSLWNYGCYKTKKKITTSLTNPYFIPATFRKSFFSSFSSFNDEKAQVTSITISESQLVIKLENGLKKYFRNVA